MTKHNIRRDFFSALTGLSVVLGAPGDASAKTVDMAEMKSVLVQMANLDLLSNCFENLKNGKNIRTLPIEDKNSGVTSDLDVSVMGDFVCGHMFVPPAVTSDGKYILTKGMWRTIAADSDMPLEVIAYMEMKHAVSGDDKSPVLIKKRMSATFAKYTGKTTLWQLDQMQQIFLPETSELNTLFQKTTYKYCERKECTPPTDDSPKNLAIYNPDVSISEKVVKVESALVEIGTPMLYAELRKGVPQKPAPQMPGVTPQEAAAIAEHMPQYRHTDSVLTPEAMAFCIKSAREDSQKYGASPVLVSPNLTCQITGGSKADVAYEVFDLTTVPGSDWNGQAIKSAQLSTVVGRQGGSSAIKYIRVEGVNFSPDGQRAWAVNLSASGEAEAPATVAYYNCPTGALCQTRNQIWPHQMGALEAAANTHMEEVARSVLKAVKPNLVKHADLMRAWSSDVAFTAQPFMEVYPWTGMTDDRPIPQPLPVFYKERTASAATFRVAAPQ